MNWLSELILLTKEIVCCKLKFEHQIRVLIKEDKCKISIYFYLRWHQFLWMFNMLIFVLKKRSNCCWIHSCNFDSSQKMSLREGIRCNQSNYSYLESRDFSRHSQHSVMSDYRHLLWRPVTMTRVFVTNWYPWVNRFCQFCQSNCIAFHRSVLIGVYSYFISICCWTLTHFDYC